MNTTTLCPAATDTAKTLRWKGGDVIVPAALCSALERVGTKLVADKRSRAQANVVAFLAEQTTIDALNEAVTEFLTGCGGVPTGMTITVTGVEPNYRGEDLGLHWEWSNGALATTGIYPVNLKNEQKHKPASISRVGRRYGILKRMTGRRHNTNCDNGTMLADSISDPGRAILGIGILAFVGCGPNTRVASYDPLLIYAMTGDDLRPGARRGDQLSRVLDEMNLGASLLPGRAVLVYDNEGTLLQSSHRDAQALWPTLVRLAFTERLYTSTLISWFETRFAKESAELLRRRAASHERDAATMGAFL